MIHSLESFRYKGTPIQVLGTYTEPLFVAKEVCDALGLKDTQSAIRKLDDDERLMRKVYASGQHREVIVINEPGLYSLVLRSTKPEAKAFKRWITHEVLPEIRKHGSYGAPEAVERRIRTQVAKERLATHVHNSTIWNQETVQRFTEVEKFLTQKELARIFGCSKSSIRKLRTLMKRASGDFTDHRPESLKPDKTPQLDLLDELPKLSASQEMKESIWRMRVIEGMKYEAIAEQTGYSVGTCRQFVEKVNLEKEARYEY